MSVLAFVGLPGAGKSYETIKKCVELKQQGRKIISNIPLTEKGKEFFGDDYVQYEKDKPPACGWAKLWDEYPGYILVVDEPWRFWAQGLKATAMPEAERSLFAEHRHSVRDGFSSDIILVTQALSDLAAFPRGKVDSTFLITNLQKVGVGSRYRVYTYSGSYQGRESSSVTKLNETYHKYDAAIWALYKSHTKSDESGVMMALDKRSNVITGNKMIFLGVPIAIVGAVIMMWHLIFPAASVSDSVANPVGLKPMNGKQPVILPSKKGQGPTLEVTGQIGDYVILSDGQVGTLTQWQCYRVLQSVGTALPQCRKLPMAVQRPVQVVEQNPYLPTYEVVK